jgi:hypothetical protein
MSATQFRGGWCFALGGHLFYLHCLLKRGVILSEGLLWRAPSKDERWALCDALTRCIGAEAWFIRHLPAWFDGAHHDT